MACRLFGTKPSSKPMLGSCQLDPWELKWNFNQNIKLFIHENTSENIVCQIFGHFVLGEMSWYKTCSMSWMMLYERVRFSCGVPYINIHWISFVQSLRNMLYTMRSRQSGHYFADGTFNCMCMYENCCIWSQISLKFVPPLKELVLVQRVMWHRTANKPGPLFTKR